MAALFISLLATQHILQVNQFNIEQCPSYAFRARQGVKTFIRCVPKKVAHLVQLSGVGRGGSGRVITPFCMEGPDGNYPLTVQELCCFMMLFYDGI